MRLKSGVRSIAMAGVLAGVAMTGVVGCSSSGQSVPATISLADLKTAITDQFTGSGAAVPAAVQACEILFGSPDFLVDGGKASSPVPKTNADGSMLNCDFKGSKGNVELNLETALPNPYEPLVKPKGLQHMYDQNYFDQATTKGGLQVSLNATLPSDIQPSSINDQEIALLNNALAKIVG